MTTDRRADIRFGRSGESLYLTVDGDATVVACPTADKLVADYLAANQASAGILIDLTSTEYVDSTFAGWMLQIRAKVAGLGRGTVSLAGCSESCRRSFDQLGMTALIQDCDVPKPEKMTTLACGHAGVSEREVAELMAGAHEELASIDDEHRQVFGPIAEALRKELEAGN